MAVRHTWRRLALAPALAGFMLIGPAMGTAAAAPYTVAQDQVLHVTGLGPNHDTACDVFYDLYTPNGASAAHPVPAILTTNGFGGSKNDQAGEAQLWASNGYEVLSYSGLGFGGSTCLVYTDDQDWDGRAASQLVSFLGNRPEVLKDGPDDPRVGTWGGSYGGGFQFALAAVDSRIDAMVPVITWNDLTHSLLPNDYSPNFVYDTSPGVEKLEWSSLFYALGNAEPAFVNQNPNTVGYSGWTNTNATSAHNGETGTPPNPACPGYEMLICTGFTESAADGYPVPTIVDRLRHASAQYELIDRYPEGSRHFPPTMLIQGENDTLFDIQDAVANYRGWKSKDAPVKLVIQEGGHSGPAAPGEYDNTNPANGYLTQLTLRWFDRYLKHADVSTGPEVEYFRDWVAYSGSAAPAYGSARSWPVGATQAFYLSGGSATAGGDLVSSPSAVQPGTETFANAPGSYSETSGANSSVPLSPRDQQGTYASYTTAPLAADLVSVGIPEVDFKLTDLNPVGDINPATEITLFGKVYDVAPDGSQSLIHNVVSAERVADVNQEVHINLPGVVHRYAKGHRVELVIATTDPAFTGSRGAHVLGITVGGGTTAVLTMPVGEAAATSQSATRAASVRAPAAATRQSAAAPAAAAPSVAAAPRAAAITPRLASTGLSPLPVGMVALGLALWLGAFLFRWGRRRA